MPNSCSDMQTKLDAWAVHSFIQAAMKTFDVQCQYPLQYEKAVSLTEAADLGVDVLAMIGMTSDIFSGSIVLCFQKNMFLSVMGKMFGESYTEIIPEIVDGAAEILNIVFGVAKTTLANEGYAVAMSIPTVLTGENLQMNSVTGGGKSVLLKFSSASGPFHIVVNFSKPKPTQV